MAEAWVADTFRLFSGKYGEDTLWSNARDLKFASGLHPDEAFSTPAAGFIEPALSKNVLLTEKGLHGAMPYFELPGTGRNPGSRSGRGYTYSYFRGTQYNYSEVEYRFPITRNKFRSGVTFFHVQTANNVLDTKLFEHWQPGGGLGLRILFNKATRINLCLDYTWSKYGAKGFFLGLNEAFNLDTCKMLILYGQVAFDPQGNFVGNNDLAKQTEQVFRNIKAITEDAGGSINDVVKLTYFIMNASQLQIIRNVRDQFIKHKTATRQLTGTGCKII